MDAKLTESPAVCTCVFLHGPWNHNFSSLIPFHYLTWPSLVWGEKPFQPTVQVRKWWQGRRKWTSTATVVAQLQSCLTCCSSQVACETRRSKTWLLRDPSWQKRYVHLPRPSTKLCRRTADLQLIELLMHTVWLLYAVCRHTVYGIYMLICV